MNPSNRQDLSGTGLSRREALWLGARAAAALSAVALPVLAVSGCSAGAKGWDHAAMVQVLSAAVLPVAGPRAADDAAFVVRAVEAGLMGARPDLLALLAEDLHRRSNGAFLKDAPARQAKVVGDLDRETFAAEAPLSHPWYSVKALILMSFYTSEHGMTQELRYEPVPGRYDSDVKVDASFRPLSNDWAGVGVRKAIAPK
jgi:hypothetical protein